MKAVIVACSNGQSRDQKAKNEELRDYLHSIGIETQLSPYLYAATDDFSATDEERAEVLMSYYRDDEIGAIYDISGGDLANGVLKHLDYDVIAKTDKLFWGYSDLTTVINAIYTLTGKPSVLYQVKHMVSREAALQRQRFSAYVNGTGNDLFDIKYEFLQGRKMKGVLVGGNIRCFLKLAGTRYWPNLKGKILLLESLGGVSGQIATFFHRLEQLGVFEQVSGIILGTFTKYEAADLELSVYDLLKRHISPELPVAMTRDIGHGQDAKAVMIGREMELGE